jgi:hypothetical protein
MKKVVLFFIVSMLTTTLCAQTLNIEKQYLNNQLNSGKLNSEQTRELSDKWNTFRSNYKYPVLPYDTIAGEFDFTDIIAFNDLDKRTIYQRCLQWFVLNSQEITYQDLEAGKIIANGSVTLTHKTESRPASGKNIFKQVQTPVNYTLVLTFKGNKIKYSIINITYSFTVYSVSTESTTEVSRSPKSLFPIISADQQKWTNYISLLNETVNAFDVDMKNAIVSYVQDVKADYEF